MWSALGQHIYSLFSGPGHPTDKGLDAPAKFQLLEKACLRLVTIARDLILYHGVHSPEGLHRFPPLSIPSEAWTI